MLLIFTHRYAGRIGSSLESVYSGEYSFLGFIFIGVIVDNYVLIELDRIAQNLKGLQRFFGKYKQKGLDIIIGWLCVLVFY